MCCTSPSQSPTLKNKSSFPNQPHHRSFIRPLPLPLLLPIIPFLPTSLYLNRGYTIWFHLCSFAYFPTRSPFLRKFLILQGFGICAGWYAAMINEYLVHGNFCHTLYRNMPESMVRHMVLQEEGGYEMLNTSAAWGVKLLSHVLDFLGHPMLVYLFWRIHVRQGGSWKDVLSWPVIISAWHTSRLWSILHSYYNKGSWECWYFGYDVYVLNDDRLYLTAYVVEGLCFGMALIWKLMFDVRPPWSDREQKLSDELALSEFVKSKDEKVLDSMPMLAHSDSAFSTSSMM